MSSAYKFGRSPQIGTRFSGGFRDTAPAPTQAQFSDAMSDALQKRMNRVAELLQIGEPYFLNVALGIAAAAAQGDQVIVVTQNQDFDLLVVGATADIYSATVEIADSSRNKLVTNGTVPISHIANCVNSSVQIQQWDWARPYLLPAKAIFTITVARGPVDEQDGELTFRCLQPPVTF